jgi:hypothetical protein
LQLRRHVDACANLFVRLHFIISISVTLLFYLWDLFHAQRGLKVPQRIAFVFWSKNVSSRIPTRRDRFLRRRQTSLHAAAVATKTLLLRCT